MNAAHKITASGYFITARANITAAACILWSDPTHMNVVPDTVSARRIDQLRQTPGAPVWQRGYHDRIIWDDREWAATRAYILDNPRRWHQDRDNLEALDYGE